MRIRTKDGEDELLEKMLLNNKARSEPAMLFRKRFQELDVVSSPSQISRLIKPAAFVGSRGFEYVQPAKLRRTACETSR